MRRISQLNLPVIDLSRTTDYVQRRTVPIKASLLAVLAVLAYLIRRAAWCTVGFAETHSRLAYNDLAVIHWIHPGDGCSEGKTCFFLEKNAQSGGHFQDLYGSLEQISVPPDRGVSLVLGESSDGGWFVYDLRDERYVVRSDSRESALTDWRTSGLPDPTLADAANLSHSFRETWTSRLEALAMLLLLFSPLVVLSLPVWLFLLGWCGLQFRRTKRVSFLAVAAALLLPSAVGLFLLIRILAVFSRLR